MCLTAVGRLHTRLTSLLLPLALALVLIAGTGDGVYARVFGLMALSGIGLDMLAYSWLIAFQPRWLFVLLGGLEWLVVSRLATLPMLQITLPQAAALRFYLASWLLAWLSIEWLLPLLHPRWAELGGAWWPTRWPRMALAQRRAAYGWAWAALLLVGSPWLVLWLPGFATSVSWQRWHMLAVYVPPSWLSGLALRTSLSLLSVYQLLWLGLGFAWLLGGQLLWPLSRWQAALLGALVLALVSLNQLLWLAAGVWLTLAVGWGVKRLQLRPTALAQP